MTRLPPLLFETRLLLSLCALSCAGGAASGCNYDERRLRVSRVAVDSSGASGNLGVLDDAAGAANESDPTSTGEAGQPSSAGASSAGASSSGFAGGSGSSGNGAGSGGISAGSGGTSSGGSSAGSGGSLAGSAASGAGGGGGAGSGGGPVPGPCGDIDANFIDDCSETLVQNSRFDLNLEHWLAEAQVTSTWDHQNATALVTSGSAKLINSIPVASAVGLTMAGAEQCVKVGTVLDYKIAARVLIPAGQGQGQAGINLWVFGGDDCKSNFLGALTPVTTQTVSSWTTLVGQATLPTGAKSMTVRLVALKPFAQTNLEVSFDDVLVRPN